MRHADQRVRLAEPDGPVRAYLDPDGLLAATRRAGSDAVWPGWGFAAEDADFADRVVAEGLRFLGPSGDVIRALGEKIGAKRLAESVGVPVVPWSRGPVSDAAVAAREAERLGFPLVIKAAAGGGGRGIRAVATAADLEPAFASAVTEARAAFADGAVFLERRLRGVRHVEVQIAAGGIYYLSNGGSTATPTWLQTTGLGTWSLDTSGVNWTDATYTIKARSTDNAGNVSTESSRSITIYTGTAAFTQQNLSLSSQTILQGDTLDLLGQL